MRYNKRVDANQALFYKTIRKNKLFTITDQSKIGQGFPDAVVMHIPSREELLVEIKDKGKRNHLTDAQKKWFENKPKGLHAIVAESPDEVFAYFKIVFKVKV